MDLLELPLEICIKIVSYLSPVDLVRLCHVNSHWYRNFSSSIMWEKIEVHKNLQYIRNYDENTLTHEGELEHCSKMYQYIQRCRVQSHWAQKQYKTIILNQENPVNIEVNQDLIVILYPQELKVFTSRNEVVLLAGLKGDFHGSYIELFENRLYLCTKNKIINYNLTDLSLSNPSVKSLPCRNLDETCEKYFEKFLPPTEYNYEIATCENFVLIVDKYLYTSKDCQILHAETGSLVASLRMPDDINCVITAEVSSSHAFVLTAAHGLYIYDIKEEKLILNTDMYDLDIVDCLICNMPTYIHSTLETVCLMNIVDMREKSEHIMLGAEYAVCDYNYKNNLILGYGEQNGKPIVQCFNVDDVLPRRARCSHPAHHSYFQYFNFRHIDTLSNDDYIVRIKNSIISIYRIFKSHVDLLYEIKVDNIESLWYVDDQKIVAYDHKDKITIIHFDVIE